MRNRLKDVLEHSEVAFGVTVTIGHPDVTEILGGIGFDFINIDMQHAPLNIETVQNLMQSMSYSQTTPIVRVPQNDYAMINSALDVGAHGIIIPLVNTRNDILKALNYALYPPKGARSYGPRRAILRDPEYVASANREILVIPQIETREAVENLEEILSVEGVKALFVGPNDLSMSLGVYAQWHHPTFEKALNTIIETAEKSGVKPGILAPIGEPEELIDRGFKLITLGKDAAFLMNAATSVLKRARAHLSSLKEKP
ncbi:hypothetical protein J7L27_00565 [Candidatus Bathyarchaeota archaeon]|nr:hypothetical protein [Candidatus Bathyarchaeota archaeon]